MQPNTLTKRDGNAKVKYRYRVPVPNLILEKIHVRSETRSGYESETGSGYESENQLKSSILMRIRTRKKSFQIQNNEKRTLIRNFSQQNIALSLAISLAKMKTVHGYTRKPVLRNYNFMSTNRPAPDPIFT